MDYAIPVVLSLLCLSLYFLRLCFTSNQRSSKLKLPPGPKPLPVFGNIFLLTDKPHSSLFELSRTYGPLFTLRLGCVTTMVISSPDMARELFLKHDLALSSRTVPRASRAHDHHNHSMSWLPVSSKWKNLRKIAAVRLFTNQQLSSCRFLREKKVLELLDYVGQCCRRGEAVDIGKSGFTTSLNLLSNTFFSTDLAGYSSKSLQEFKETVWAIMEAFGKPNMADFFPILDCLDPSGLRQLATVHTGKMFAVFDSIIAQRLSNERASDSSSVNDDALETLLNICIKDENELRLDDVRHLLLELFIAGTDTTSLTLEWAMTELLRNPSKLAKAQAEVRQVVGKDGPVRESDIQQLPYLQAVVKETLRIHPPGPLLLPRKAEMDIDFCGYRVPKNTKVLVNAWAIGRDPSTWKEPSLFSPERFLKLEIDFKGRDFELIPFGAGRRICPGMPLAHRMIHLMLAALLYSFDWKLANGMKEEDLDMTEKFGITLQKAEPLLALPLPQ